MCLELTVSSNCYYRAYLFQNCNIRQRLTLLLCPHSSFVIDFTVILFVLFYKQLRSPISSINHFLYFYFNRYIFLFTPATSFIFYNSSHVLRNPKKIIVGFRLAAGHQVQTKRSFVFL